MASRISVRLATSSDWQIEPEKLGQVLEGNLDFHVGQRIETPGRSSESLAVTKFKFHQRNLLSRRFDDLHGGNVVAIAGKQHREVVVIHLSHEIDGQTNIDGFFLTKVTVRQVAWLPTGALEPNVGVCRRNFILHRMPLRKTLTHDNLGIPAHPAMILDHAPALHLGPFSL